MTKDDIIRMAKETSATRAQAGLDAGTLPWLEHFANLVAAAEREACDELCQDIDGGDNMFARAIRTRSQS